MNTRHPSGPRALIPALLLLAALAGCAGAGRGPGAVDAPLPVDPALVRGTLDNGLAYIVRRHPNPRGRMAIWLHVATGSLNETEDTRGIAHYLEHMAFNGSTNFPPGSLVPFFQGLGLSFGRDQNAFTGFDQTVYTLALPDTEEATLARSLVYLADVAFGLSLLPEEIDKEREIILEERRARTGARQRVREAVLERLAPESTLGRRLPIGTEAAIRAVGPAEFRDFYARWYVASNMTVIAVGDADPDVVVEAIRRHFAAASSRPRPAPRPAGVRASRGLRAIIATDPDLTQAEVSLTRVEPARPPVTTAGAYRRRLVDDLGVWIFNRRLEADLAEGRVAFQTAGASTYQLAGAARIASSEAVAAPERWRPALADIATSIQRARQHGFTADEVAEASAARLAAAEQAAQQEPTVPARQLLRQLNGAVTRGEIPMAAAQRLELERELLPGISAPEVSRTFADDFDPRHLVVALTLPTSADVPTEPELRALGQRVFAVQPAALSPRARATTLLKELPPAGTVVERQVHEATAVWSGWLDNGLRLHHRRVDSRKNEASIVITLAGGVIEEHAGNRGATEAAVEAWNRPATSTLSSTEIRRLMIDKKVRVSGGLGQDTVTLTVAGDPAALGEGLALAYLLLTDPVVEPAGFAQWQERRLHEIAEAVTQPRAALVQAEADAFYAADEVRLRPLTAPQVRTLTPADVQGWLRSLIARAPIEVVVVGDLERDVATTLVGRYLGALPARERIGSKTLGRLRALPRPAGPIQVARTVTTQTNQAQVLDGFFGADVQETRESRLLILAARVLSTRMNRQLREERQLVYSIGAFSRPGEAYPGFGRFAAQAPTDPAKAEALADAIEEMFGAFAAQGPTAEELVVAKQQLANLLGEIMSTPDFWRERLATLDYRGLSLDDLGRIAADYAGFTAEEVRAAFNRYHAPAARFRLVIIPRTGGVP
jgi:zinc protease